MTFLNYPRLPTSDASELVLELASVDPRDRVQIGQSYSGRSSTYETAVRLADDAHLTSVRAEVLQHAEAHGFPDKSPNGGFDAGLPSLLDRVLKLSPAEAGAAEVWNYLALVLLPDVALWRWPNTSNNPAYERLIGKPRNVFRRHWWRARLIGADLTVDLNEDEIVQIVERPASLGGDRRVARAIAQAFLSQLASIEVDPAGGTQVVRREELMRSLAKRTMLIGRVVALSTLSDDELADLAGELAAMASSQLIGSEVRRPQRRAERATLPTPTPTPTPTDDAVERTEDEAERLLTLELQRLDIQTSVEVGMTSAFMSRMLSDFGGVGAARRMLEEAGSEWFGTVTRAGRVDLTIEAVVLRDPWRSLFTASELDGASRRLDEFERTTRDGASEEALADELLLLDERTWQTLGSRLPDVAELVRSVGAVRAVRQLVNSAEPSGAFEWLRRWHRLDLSVEALVLDPRFDSLIEIAIQEVARDRLAQNGYETGDQRGAVPR